MYIVSGSCYPLYYSYAVLITGCNPLLYFRIGPCIFGYNLWVFVIGPMLLACVVVKAGLKPEQFTSLSESAISSLCALVCAVWTQTMSVGLSFLAAK